MCPYREAVKDIPHIFPQSPSFRHHLCSCIALKHIKISRIYFRILFNYRIIDSSLKIALSNLLYEINDIFFVISLTAWTLVLAIRVKVSMYPANQAIKNIGPVAIEKCSFKEILKSNSKSLSLIGMIKAHHITT